MINIDKIISEIENELGVTVTSINAFGRGNNNNVLLIKTSKGKFVYKYNLSKDTQNPLRKVYYKCKKFRRTLIRIQTNLALKGKENSFARKTYGKSISPYLIQQKAHEICTKVNVPQITLLNSDVIEEFGGYPVTDEFTNPHLAPKYAKDLGGFLGKLHSELVLKPSKTPLYKNLNLHMPLAFRAYKNCFSSKLLSIYNNSIQKLKKLGNTDEYRVLTHFDIKKTNVLINEDSKLSLIDWEFAGIKPMYADFISNGAYARDIPYTFIKDMLEEYNKTSPIKINPDKLKHLTIIALIDSFFKTSMLKARTKEYVAKELNSSILQQLDEIECVFNEEQEKI